MNEMIEIKRSNNYLLDVLFADGVNSSHISNAGLSKVDMNGIKEIFEKNKKSNLFINKEELQGILKISDSEFYTFSFSKSTLDPKRLIKKTSKEEINTAIKIIFSDYLRKINK